MRYKKASIITLGLLFSCVFLLSIFNVYRAEGQAIESSATEKAETSAVCSLGKKVKNFPFYVYKDANSRENNFFSTGYMGDSSSTEVDTYCKESPFSGSSCVKIVYKKSPGKAYHWSGLYWQYPPNNWGNIPKAYDLTGATKLTFWARGKAGGEIINKFQVGGITGEYRDSGVASIGPISLSRKWRKYTINLSNMDNSIIISNEDKECWPFMEPLTRVIGGFCWATSLMESNSNSNRTGNSNKSSGITFYLDEIKFEND